ncbi:MAG: hypothetical protein U0559_18180 [Anaerolineae bacterium]
MSTPASDLETRFHTLEVQLAQQTREIQQLRKGLVTAKLRAWLVPGLVAVLLLIAGAGGILPAVANGVKGIDTPTSPSATGGAVILGAANSTTATTDLTRIINPSITELMPRTLRIGNYSNSDVGNSYSSGFRTALVAMTSGVDTSSGQVRVGVMGLVDNSGYGVYGASPDGTGVTGISNNGIGGEFSGGTAQLRLVPGVTAGPPTGSSHLTGELYLDSNGDLYLCTSGGVGAKWAKLNLLASYLPTIQR